MKPSNLEQFLSAAVRASRIAGAIVRRGFRSEQAVEFKGFADPVTQFDKASEEAAVGHLLSRFPGHSILTEEKLSREADTSHRWIIDPLDGTVNFTHRIPFVSVSIALELEGRIAVGVVYNPVLEELYTAIRGGGACLNGKPIHVSSASEIGKSLVATGFPYARDGRIEELMKPMPVFLRDYQGYRRLGSATMDLVYVARGSFEGFYEENLKPWDTAAGILLVEEAGGRVTDYYGNPYSVRGNTILATNGLIHSPMADMLRDVKPPK
jgi:myo-inositol-1(or 4)-monophosphatase